MSRHLKTECLGIVSMREKQGGGSERTQIKTHVDLRCVAPDVVPDIVGEDLRPAAAS
jgi:hypothetical protein